MILECYDTQRLGRERGFNDCSIVITVVGNIPFHKRETMSLWWQFEAKLFTTSYTNRVEHVFKVVIRVVFSVYEGLIYLLISRHEVHGYERLVSFGLKPVLYQTFKRLSTECDDENSHDCVSHPVSHLKYWNIVELVEFYGRLCSLLYWKYFIKQLPRTLGS